MSKILPSLGLFALLFVGCEKNDDPVAGPATTTRAFSAALRATCTTLPSAGRSLATAPVEVGTNPTLRLGYEVYDTLGTKVVGSTLVTTTARPEDVATADPKTFQILWNGLDASGRRMPTGHYFLFLEARDSAGALLRRDSTCIGWLAP